MCPAQNLNALATWMRLATAYSRMTISAGEVVFHRLFRIATGAMTPPEATAMVMEKATAFALAMEKAAIAAARGGDPVKIATAALRPYGTKTRSNARRLRR